MLVNLLAWIPKSTRKLHMIILVLTIVSWIGLGYFFGWGYCILTDWHWDILEYLGERPFHSAFVAYFFDRVFNVSMSNHFSNIITIAGLIFGLSGAIYVNIIIPKWKKKKRTS
jgi:hypothetical protein